MAKDEQIQHEIVERVLALDGSRTAVSVSAAEIEGTIDALDELTQVEREDIEAIARQVRLEHEAQPDFPTRVRDFAKDSGYKVLGAMLTSFIIIGVFRYTTSAPSASVASHPAEHATPLHAAQTRSQADYVKAAELGQVLSTITFLKVAMMEHYMQTGEFAASLAALGYNKEDMTDGKYIAGVDIARQGAIMVSLASSFGDERQLALVPSLTMGGAQVAWQCVTTLPAEVVTHVRVCESRSDLERL